MIIAAIVILLIALVALGVGVLLDDDGSTLLWVAVVAAPLSLVALWIGLRRMRPPRGDRHP